MTFQLKFLFILSLLIYSCKHESVQKLTVAGGTKDTAHKDTSGCDTVLVNYSSTIKIVLKDNCLRCHGASVYQSLGSGYNFDDYTVLKAEVDNDHVAKAINHAAGAVRMPIDKSEKISDCDIRKFMIWIGNGAPDN